MDFRLCFNKCSISFCPSRGLFLCIQSKPAQTQYYLNCKQETDVVILHIYVAHLLTEIKHGAHTCRLHPDSLMRLEVSHTLASLIKEMLKAAEIKVCLMKVQPFTADCTAVLLRLICYRFIDQL